jgi:HSP20 family protein
LAENSRSNRRKKKKTFFFGNEIDLERFLKEIKKFSMRETNKKTEKPRKKKLYPLAYSVTIGPYGRVYIRELGHFGCFANIQGSLKPNHELEPLVDIIEEDDKVHVVVELPQVDKEQIKIIGTEKNLIIQVNSLSQQPSMNIDLPCYVDLDTAKATLKNGVLEIVMKIERSSSFKVKRIDIN